MGTFSEKNKTDNTSKVKTPDDTYNVKIGPEHAKLIKFARSLVVVSKNRNMTKKEFSSSVLGTRYAALARHIYKLSDRLYREVILEKSNGGTRIINEPNPYLKSIQRNLYYYMSENFPVSVYAHGFTKGKSIITNADIHKKKKIIIKMDIKEFFPSISFARIYGMLQAKPFEMEKDIAVLISQIVCLPGKNQPLPQGAPTSPLFANYVCRKLDARLGKLCQNMKMHYSRYADDMTFSTNVNISVQGFIEKVSEIITEEGFKVNSDKTKIMYPGNRQIVTGIVVNDGLNVNRRYIKNLRAILFNIKNGKLLTQMQKSPKDKRIRHLDLKFDKDQNSMIDAQGRKYSINVAKNIYLDHLRGRISFIESVLRVNKDYHEKYAKRYRHVIAMKEDWNTIVSKEKLELTKFAISKGRELDPYIEGFTREQLENYIHEAGRQDARYWLEGVENISDLQEMKQKVSYLKKHPVSKEAVVDLLRYFKDSQTKFLGRIVHDEEITWQDFNEFVRGYKDKIFQKIPVSLDKTISQAIVEIQTYMKNRDNWENGRINLWSDEEFRAKVLQKLKLATRFSRGGDGRDLKEEIHKLTEKHHIPKTNIRIQVKQLYTHTESFLKALDHILQSMSKHSGSKNVHLEIFREDKIVVQIYDRKKIVIPGSPDRSNHANGKIQNAMKSLHGYCNYSITAFYDDFGWAGINMFQREKAQAVESDGYTHTLEFVKL